ncbi:DUF1330 domain-containing protein [Pelagovum pacificum]|uniref:DUF1330 domain-containing protein n=1 Tax=Pelagovum pacificum TaxID=2588711 RepID=A0A5C5G8Q9_9RHOB|nr:DUF1330 domain-containing protein [Pelagovum pacificum]QQA42026.1 DUF1330 domain-containing protein [Pelagovum pacificum]TNY31116.1 DUF1330 domain-containing protein [Pelagovum pacificum]
MPKGYIIGHITVTNPEAYKEYVARDTPILEGFGGKFIVRGGESEVAEGSLKQRHVVVEFPDYETAKKAFYSPEYQEVARIRIDNAESDMLLVEGT